MKEKDEEDKGMVRKIDDIGRLVIPIEIRRTMGWSNKQPIEMKIEGNKVVLEKYVAACFLCGTTDNLKNVKEKKICRKCLEDLKEM